MEIIDKVILLTVGMCIGSIANANLIKYDSAIAVYKKEIVCKQIINDWHCEKVKGKQ